MRGVSGVRRACVWLAAALLLVAAASAEAGRLRVKEAVKRVIPQVGQQLSKIAVNGKVAITAACVATACLINFASPTEANVAATDEQVTTRKSGAVDFLTPDAAQGKTRGVGGIFVRNLNKRGNQGIDFSHWMGKGVYHESGNNFGTLRIGTKVSAGSFSAFITTAYRWHPDTTDGIDDIGIKTRTFAGARTLLVDNGEGNMSYGYLDGDIFVGGKKMIFRNGRAYLLHYHKGPLQIAGLGYEYVDKDLDALTTEGESADAVRSHGVGLYRAGLVYPITDLFTTSDALAIDLQLNSAMHLGDIGPAKLGETWQGELNNWAGDEADLDHLLYHVGAASVNMYLADGRVKLTLGGIVHHTIDGDIKRPGRADGNFEIVNTTVSVGGVVNLLPEHNISLEAIFDRYDQHAEGNIDGKMYEYDASGTWLRTAINKAF